VGEVVFWLVLGAGVGSGLGCGGEIDDDDEGEDLGVSRAGAGAGVFRDCQGAVWNRRKVRGLRGAVVSDWSLRRGDSRARWSG